MHMVLKKPLVLGVWIVLALCITASADTIPFSFTSGTAGSSDYQSVSGTLTSGNGTVTLTISNNLTNVQVFSIIQNISGIYFTVTGYQGTSSIAASDSDQSTSIINKQGTLQGAVSPTGWTTVDNIAGGLGVCVICPGGNPPVGPESTIVGGTGSGSYASANGSLNNNNPHNPFLVGEVTFTLNVTGVTADSTFDRNSLFIQFGTTAASPTAVPYSGSLSLLVMTGLVMAGALSRRYR
jgi:hypothetical protein